MEYKHDLIHITNIPESSDSMYSIICLHAYRLTLILNDVRCYLDGKYLLCLSTDDTLSVAGGTYEAINLRFQLYFYNVNLNHNVIGLGMYEEMRSHYGYPDFHLFRERDDPYFGILHLSDEEYTMIRDCITSAGRHIENNEWDGMWSCRVRSDMISVLRIAEGVYHGETMCGGSEVIRYIRDHIGEEITIPSLCKQFNTNRTSLAQQIKAMTGLSPMQYVLEERLNQSRPDLLFTYVPIHELSEKYGFSDVNYYIRAFRKRFGITPLQYRTEGRAERIRNETIYHQREREMMKVSDFKDYIEKGLGRGLLLLQREADKTPYRKTLVDYYTKDTFHLRFHSVYDAELIRCFEDSDALSAEIAVSLFEDIKQGKKLSMIPVLLELGYHDTVTAIIEYMYSSAHKELVEYTKSGRTDDVECVSRYFSAVVGLGYLKVPRERMKRALLDMADFYYYTETPQIPHRQNPFFGAANGYGSRELFSLGLEVADEHPHGGKIYRDYHRPAMPPSTPEKQITAEEIFSAYKEDGCDMELLFAFARASEDVIRTVAEELLREDSPKRRCYLMDFFSWGLVPDLVLPLFPLDPTPLIAEAEKLKPVSWEEDREASRIVHTYYAFLGKIRHPDVKALGQRLLADETLDVFLREGAADMVFGANFEPQETQAFLDYLKNEKNQQRWNVVFHALDMKTEIPDEILECAFEMSCNWRVSLVCKMCEVGRLPESIREECRYDSNIYIRNLVKENNE